MKLSRKKLQVIRGGLPNLFEMTDAELLKSWKAVCEKCARLDKDAKDKEQVLREAAKAYDEVISELNELSHMLRHYRRELGRRSIDDS